MGTLLLGPSLNRTRHLAYELFVQFSHDLIAMRSATDAMFTTKRRVLPGARPFLTSVHVADHAPLSSSVAPWPLEATVRGYKLALLHGFGVEHFADAGT